jgi:hypothetical protein
MKVECKDNRCIAPRELRGDILRCSIEFEGGRRWLNNGSFSFENTPHNINVLEKHGIPFEKAAKTSAEASQELFAGFSTRRPVYAPPERFFKP